MGDWLVGEFTFLGVHFQNWMLVAAIVVVLAIIWMTRRR
jgi:hypothetical protein